MAMQTSVRIKIAWWFRAYAWIAIFMFETSVYLGMPFDDDHLQRLGQHLGNVAVLASRIEFV